MIHNSFTNTHSHPFRWYESTIPVTAWGPHGGRITCDFEMKLNSPLHLLTGPYQWSSLLSYIYVCVDLRYLHTIRLVPIFKLSCWQVGAYIRIVLTYNLEVLQYSEPKRSHNIFHWLISLKNGSFKTPRDTFTLPTNGADRWYLSPTPTRSPIYIACWQG